MAVQSAYGAWLKSDALYSTSVVAGAAASWGNKAVTTTVISPLVSKADADAECARQAAFLSGVRAQDTAVVKGQRRDLIGKAITLNGDRLGYEAGAIVFVIAADETAIVGCTVLKVIKRL